VRHQDPLNIPDTQRELGRWRVLSLATISFFLTFVAWYSLGPFVTSIARALHLSAEQTQVLLLCNLALTIPARIGVGMLVDRFGPRRVYAGVLIFAAFPCIGAALSNQFWQLVICRLLISCVGAGFVVGIRLVGEWFDASEIGLAEGVYGGLGNFGMAAATFGLPLIALPFGYELGWRWATALVGVVSMGWGVWFLRKAVDAPPGREFRRPKRRGAMEVSSRGALAGLVLLQFPMALCLGITAWRLTRVHFLPVTASYVIYFLLLLLLAQQIGKIIRTNANVVAGTPVPLQERYSFLQVAILSLCYAATFGGELAVEQMLPGYFEKLFHVSVVVAGVMGAGFAFANFIARPLGGYLGDRLGRKPIMIVTLCGSALGFSLLPLINAHWPLWGAMGLVVGIGFFLMGGNGANFCIVPLIRKPLTGQIAGLVGAYGSVGSVLFTTILLLTNPQVFFECMAATAAIAFAACLLLEEPGAAPATANASVPSIQEETGYDPAMAV